MPSPLIRVSCHMKCSSLPVTGREALTNGDLFHKCKFILQKGNFYSVFRASLMSAVS